MHPLGTLPESKSPGACAANIMIVVFLHLNFFLPVSSIRDGCPKDPIGHATLKSTHTSHAPVLTIFQPTTNLDLESIQTIPDLVT